MNNLQSDAEEIIDVLKIDFSHLGEFHLVGNAALKTTVKADIDYQLYPSEIAFAEAADIIKGKLEDVGIQDLAIRDLKQSNKYLVTGKYLYHDKPWTIDISITNPKDNYIDDAYKFFIDYHARINDEARKKIIVLKKYFLNKGMLWNGMSYFIYRAVLEEDAKSPKDIFGYLKNNKINISRFRKGKNDKSSII